MSSQPPKGIEILNRTGISPVTARTVVWVTDDRVAGLAWAAGWCGFRLWRTPPGYGKPDAGVCVVLCCKAVAPQGDDPRLTPEGLPSEGLSAGQGSNRKPAGRNSRRHETRKAT